ncbi:MAG: polysialyltransferase family glycosyltransferase [Acutalibacter sp.]
MGKRILVTCCTPYQVLTAMQVLAAYYPEDRADLIVTDQMSASRKVWEGAKKCGAFGRVYYLEEKRLNGLARGENLKNILRGVLGPEKLLGDFLQLEGAYDVFLFSNMSLMNQYLVLGLKKRNPGLSWMLFEDGASTYSRQVGDLVLSRSLKVRMQLYALQGLKGIYLFHPETLAWKPPCPVYSLPGKYQRGTLEALNRIFQYDQLPDRYDRPVLFFEESYPCDGVDIGDVALVDRVARLVGKENILVKIHPRNRVNRFQEAGYATNQDTSMPWELIVLNSSFERTLFLTVGSSAATNPWCVFGIPAKAVFLCNLVEEPQKLRTEVLDQTKEICRQRPDLFFFPSTWEECEELIPRLLKEARDNSGETRETKKEEIL